MEKRVVGNRRDEKALEEYKKEQITLKFKLIEQPNFKGSKELLEYMQYCERAYRSGNPVISDEEWDRLVKETGYVESLDQVVSPDGRQWVKMKTPLLSLAKADSVEGFRKFASRFPEGQKFVVSPKLDGLTFNAVFSEVEDGSFVREHVTTRGDGINGLKLHKDALEGVEVFGLPDYISKEVADELREAGCVIDNVIEVRGEAVIDRFRYCEENGLDPKSLVARSVAAGIFNRKQPCNEVYLAEALSKEHSVVYEGADSSEFDSAWASVTKAGKSLASSAGLVSKSSPYDAVLSVSSESGKSLYVRYKEGGQWVRLQDAPYKGAVRKEHLWFITFGISTYRGNVDDRSLIEKVPGLIYVNSIEDFKDVCSDSATVDEAVKCIDAMYGTVEGVRDYSLVRVKSTLRFSCDGVVVKPVGSDSSTQKVDVKVVRGKQVVPKYPSDQIAVKLPTERVRTRIVKITQKETSLGNVAVTAEVEPVVVETGAVVRNVNLHNPNWLAMPENSWIKEGAECDLIMSMDIIPIILPPIDR